MCCCSRGRFKCTQIIRCGWSLADDTCFPTKFEIFTFKLSKEFRKFQVWIQRWGHDYVRRHEYLTTELSIRKLYWTIWIRVTEQTCFNVWDKLYFHFSVLREKRDRHNVCVGKGEVIMSYRESNIRQSAVGFLVKQANHSASFIHITACGRKFKIKEGLPLMSRQSWKKTTNMETQVRCCSLLTVITRMSIGSRTYYSGSWGHCDCLVDSCTVCWSLIDAH